jgi:hypothetical protein
MIKRIIFKTELIADYLIGERAGDDLRILGEIINNNEGKK